MIYVKRPPSASWNRQLYKIFVAWSCHCHWHSLLKLDGAVQGVVNLTGQCKESSTWLGRARSRQLDGAVQGVVNLTGQCKESSTWRGRARSRQLDGAVQGVVNLTGPCKESSTVAVVTFLSRATPDNSGVFKIDYILLRDTWSTVFLNLLCRRLTHLIWCVLIFNYVKTTRVTVVALLFIPVVRGETGTDTVRRFLVVFKPK